MEFGSVAVEAAEGAILAHSLHAGGLRLRKGRTLSTEDIAALAGAGIAEVTVARLAPGDLSEDAAAARIAAALAPDAATLGLSVSAPFTGRVNLFAEAPGVLRVERAAVDALNAVDQAITLATLPDHARVKARQMVATVKIIPYAIASAQVTRALEGLDLSALDTVLIENVGNLVCPAEFDVGEHAKAMVYSVTEGEDKPLKYPVMFRSADAIVVNKVDLLPHLDFDIDLFLSNVEAVNPGVTILKTSARTGEGVDEVVAWLGNHNG